MHISDYGEVKYYNGVFIPDYAKKEIEDYANTIKEKKQPETKRNTTPFREVEKGDYVKVYMEINLLTKRIGYTKIWQPCL